MTDRQFERLCDELARLTATVLLTGVGVISVLVLIWFALAFRPH